MKRRLIFTSICVLIGIVPAIAQFPVAPSLNAAIEAALAYNTQIKNQTLEQRKSTEAARAVWNKYLPQLSATAAYAYLNHDLKIDVPTVQLPLSGAQLFEGSTTLHNKGNVFLAGLTAKQVLFSGGQILYGAKAMEAKNEGDRLMSETHKDEVIRDVIQSFDAVEPKYLFIKRGGNKIRIHPNISKELMPMNPRCDRINGSNREWVH